MSWDSYIDNLKSQAEGNVDKACIIGLDGGSPWTTAHGGQGLVPQGNEAQDIAKCFKSQDFSQFMQSGVHLEGVKYQFLRVEDKKIVFAKRKDFGALTLQSSKTAIVIGHTAEGKQQGAANKAVGVIGEYLESLGM